MLMKTALIATLSLAALAFTGLAQTAATKAEPKPDEIRRLNAVTWDLKTHTLSWSVEKGTETNGEFSATSTQRYEIKPDAATMAVAEENRRLDHDEAALLHRLLDTITLYCAQSVVWWDHGEGERVMNDREGRPPDATKPDGRPQKPAVKPGSAKPLKALPLGVAEVAAHPAGVR